MKFIHFMLRKSTIAVVALFTVWAAFLILFPDDMVRVVAYAIAGYFVGSKTGEVWDHFEAKRKETLDKV